MRAVQYIQKLEVQRDMYEEGEQAEKGTEEKYEGEDR
jgi:hypothetical protein